MASTSNAYATTRDEVAPGARVLHVTTGGAWTVLVVHPDGSILGRSDMGARRTVTADKVEAGLALARLYANA